MAGEDYRSARERLSRQLDELRRDHAPADSLANALSNLIQLHLGHENTAAARLALTELDGLRRPGEVQVEAEYYLGAARLAVQEEAAERAVWLAERALTLGRRHLPSDQTSWASRCWRSPMPSSRSGARKSLAGPASKRWSASKKPAAWTTPLPCWFR